MTIRYLSYIPDEITYDWNLGDCFVAHSNKQLAFFLYRPGRNGSDFMLYSICIAVAGYEGESCENMILFHNDALKGVGGSIKHLKSFLSPFKNDLIKDILEQSSDILINKQDVWDSRTIIKIATWQENLEWNELQNFHDNAKVITPEVIQYSGGMPPEYRISAVDNCETGTELRASELDDCQICQWGRYEVSGKNSKVVIKHPSFGKKEFDRIRMYKSHIVGWTDSWHEDDEDDKTICRLYSSNNVSSEYQFISYNSYDDCHIAVRKDGNICILDGKTSAESISLSADYDCITEMHPMSIVVKRDGKFRIHSTLNQNHYDISDYDEVIWQKEKLFFVRNDNSWRVYDNNGFTHSKSFREIRWVTDDLICGTDGAGNYTIFIPSENNKKLYYGPTPKQFLSDLKEGKTSNNTTEKKFIKPDSKIVSVKKNNTLSSQEESANCKSMSYLIIDKKTRFKFKTISLQYCLNYPCGNNNFFSAKNIKGKTIYFLNYEKEELYETLFLKKDTFSIIDTFKFNSDFRSVIKKESPLWYIHEQSFHDHQAIVDFAFDLINKINDLSINRMIITDEIIDNFEKNKVSQQKAIPILPQKTQSKNVSVKGKTNNISDVISESREGVPSAENSSINIKKRSVQTYEVQTSLKSCGKKPCIIQTTNNKGVELTPKATYDGTLFNRRIPNNCNYNYYFSVNKDIVILIPNNILEEMEKSGKYEIKGSGKDPKFSQTIGKNENGKVCHQKKYNSRIYIFSIIGPDRFMFYDEVKYLSHRIEKPEPYKNDVIIFNFESVLK